MTRSNHNHNHNHNHTQVKENDVRLFFARFHALVTDALVNPFYVSETRITSRRFLAGVHALVAPFNSSAGSVVLG